MGIYDEFISEVSRGRNLSRSDVKALADGRISTGARAKQLELVDCLGDLYDVPDKAAELGGIKGEPKVLYMNRASFSRLLLSLTFLCFLGFSPAYFIQEQDIIKHQGPTPS
jgi:protease IV